IATTLGFPCILKLPDSAFSRGVVKVEDQKSMDEAVADFLSQSDLIVAQEFMPTDFDWRVGVWEREPLFVCRYYMAKDHWQIIKRDRAGRRRIGKVENIPVADAPPSVISTAVTAANLIGDGLYGVDLKQSGDHVRVVEINDNPNVDAGNEDRVSK